jgi:hypothetical protein
VRPNATLKWSAAKVGFELGLKRQSRESPERLQHNAGNLSDAASTAIVEACEIL